MDTRKYKGQDIRKDIKRNQRTKAYQDMRHLAIEHQIKLEGVIKDLKVEYKKLSDQYQFEVERNEKLADNLVQFKTENGNLMVTVAELRAQVVTE